MNFLANLILSEGIEIFFIKKIYVFYFHRCAGFSLVAGNKGYGLVAVHRLLAMAQLVAEHGLQSTQASVITARGFHSCGFQALKRWLSSYGAQAQLLRGMWDHPMPRIELPSPSLAGGFFTTELPRKPCFSLLSSLGNGSL